MRFIIYKIGKYLKPMLPNLPTDNLYKFGFVGSLFLIGLIVYYTVKIELSLRNSYDKYKIENLQLDLDFELLRSDFLSLESEIDFWKSKDKGVHHSKKDSLSILIDNLEFKKNAFSKIQMKTNAEITSLEAKICQFFWFKCIFLVLLSLLLYFTYWVGKMWYYKLQIHQDKIIEIQANEDKLRQM